MRLTINLDNNALITSLDFPETISGTVAGVNVVSAKRGDTPPVEFIFGRPFNASTGTGGLPEDIDAAVAIASFKFGCKLPGDYGGDYVISNWDGSEFAWDKFDGSTFTDAATTNASPTLTSATAAFTSADIGLAIAGTGIPAETTIIGVTNATTVTLSANATATASGVTITITGRTTRYRVLPSFNTDPLNDALVDGEISQTVANEAARYALVGLALGTIIKQTDTATYWIVINASQLNNAAGWDNAPQLDSIDLIAELEWQLVGQITSSTTFTLRVFNDVNKGIEGVPTDANPDVASQLAGLQNVGKTIFVDSVFGNDGTGARQNRGLAFATLPAAKAAWIAGDVIEVLPGAYMANTSLAGAKWLFRPGTTITTTNAYSSTGIFDDGGSAMTTEVRGHGNFVVNDGSGLGAPIVKVSHASSSVVFEAEDCTGNPENNNGFFVQSAGSLTLHIRSSSSTNGPCVQFSGGTLKIKEGEHVTTHSGGTIEISGTTTGRIEISGRLQGSGSGYPIKVMAGTANKTCVLMNLRLVGFNAYSIFGASPQVFAAYGLAQNLPEDVTGGITFSPNAGVTMSANVS